MPNQQNEGAPLPHEPADPLVNLRALARKALAAPDDLTREQIQELGYALLVATRDEQSKKPVERLG